MKLELYQVLVAFLLREGFLGAEWQGGDGPLVCRNAQNEPRERVELLMGQTTWDEWGRLEEMLTGVEPFVLVLEDEEE
ncbi:MAG: hypothetical protein JSS66_07760 [Armatimonadetes bacterium]|nr:hypothetical protein [Armatimonadota bacterium]